ncbi:hypothetical protein L226DRAFT_300397 [Lentinus tigrinus ALCF2SS1-7]|uniref:Uncharacterized protein n=1 Tax=Lentinus tigrinus ALCF2SS1-6 TaxID=1328759 RepID=A0A5C2S274_9APHY|nr:hypothetical protein L227DRAFT_224825 [Lentinus tigrinus ALCF2SS1-6]RPD78702.1 hypothetical protein L226DRAFT_300397 [Lentinus tigrinus ALCF2SS1-7]
MLCAFAGSLAYPPSADLAKWTLAVLPASISPPFFSFHSIPLALAFALAFASLPCRLALHRSHHAPRPHLAYTLTDRTRSLLSVVCCHITCAQLHPSSPCSYSPKHARSVGLIHPCSGPCPSMSQGPCYAMFRGVEQSCFATYRTLQKLPISSLGCAGELVL